MLADIEILRNIQTDRYIVINKVNKTRDQINYAGACTLFKLLGQRNANHSFNNLKDLNKYVKEVFE